MLGVQLIFYSIAHYELCRHLSHSSSPTLPSSPPGSTTGSPLQTRTRTSISPPGAGLVDPHSPAKSRARNPGRPASVLGLERCQRSGSRRIGRRRNRRSYLRPCGPTRMWRRDTAMDGRTYRGRIRRIRWMMSNRSLSTVVPLDWSEIETRRWCGPFPPPCRPSRPIRIPFVFFRIKPQTPTIQPTTIVSCLGHKSFIY
jgi:hypothetical protein